MDNTQDTQEMTAVKLEDNEVDKPAGFFREATIGLLYYVLMIAAVGAVIFALGYIIVEYIVPSLARAFTYPVEAGIVVLLASILSFYAGSYRKKRRG